MKGNELAPAFTNDHIVEVVQLKIGWHMTNKKLYLVSLKLGEGHQIQHLHKNCL